MGRASIALDGVGAEQEDLRNDRGLAQSPDRGRAPLCLSGRHCAKRSWAGEVRNVSLLVAIGVSNEGYREILGICEGAKEDKAGWSSFLKHLKERGLTGVQLIISDACMGLAESAVEFFPDAAWQRCIVHWYRNILPSTRVREIAAMLKAIHASEDIVAAREKAVRVIDKLRGLRLAKAAELVEAAVEETLTYYAFPEEHWRRIRTTDEMDKDFFARWSACWRSRMTAPANLSSHRRSTPILTPAFCPTSTGCANASSPIGPRSRTLPSNSSRSPPMTSWPLSVRQPPSSCLTEAQHEEDQSCRRRAH